MSIVFTISGVFRSGKSSVVKLACDGIEGRNVAIPYTTRTPHTADSRDSEFFFTSREVFELMIAREEFLEYVSISGNYYGTPSLYLQQARENGKDLLIQVDDCGVTQIKQKVPDAVSILIVPGRSARDKQAFVSSNNPRAPFILSKILLPSLEEVLLAPQMLNPNNYDRVIVNNRIEDSVKQVIDLVRTERMRRSLKADEEK